MALASAVVDGGVVVKALLILGLWLAGWGAARLASVGAARRRAGRPVRRGHGRDLESLCRRAAAAGALESAGGLRLPAVGGGDGAALRGAPRLHARRENAGADRTECGFGGIVALLFWMALAGLTPTGLMLAATIALACALAPGAGRSRWWCAGLSFGAAVTAARCRGWSPPRCPAGRPVAGPQAMASGVIEAFAARAEPGLGTLGSLAGLGGIWNADAVPASRTTLFAVVATVVLLAVVAFGTAACCCAGGPHGRCWSLAVAVGGGAGADGDGPGPGGGGGGDRRRARPRSAARRAEVGGAGGAGLRAGRRRGRRHAAPPAARRAHRRACAAPRWWPRCPT